MDGRVAARAGSLTGSTSATTPRLSPAPHNLYHCQRLACPSSTQGASEGSMRRYLVASLMAVIVGSTICTAATAHEGWFVCVCPAKTEANRIHLAFSGGRQGFNWSWIKGRTPDETDLPRRFRSVARVYMRGSTASTPSNVQPHAYVCVGFRDHIVQRMEFDDHENHQKSWNDTDDCAC